MKLLLPLCFMLLLTAIVCPLAAQVVISELMIDPAPPVQLPNAEYIELFNGGTAAVSLKGWNLQVGTSHVALPDYKIESQAYVLLTDDAHTNLFDQQQYGNVLYVPHFPSLSNSEASICLRSASGKAVYTLHYTNAWYGTKEKSNGGWSIEMIDVRNHCANVAENYGASVNSNGGTPGKVNSHNNSLVSIRATKAESVWVENDSQLCIQFNRPLDSSMLACSENYHFIEHNNHPRSVRVNSITSDRIQVTTAHLLRRNQIEHLQIQIDNCETGIKQLLTIAVALPDSAVDGTALVNELLFDASDTGEEFIELFNNSSKVIDLKDISISVLDSAGAAGKAYYFSNSGMLFFPGEYYAFSKDTAAVRSCYPAASVGNLRQIALPAFNNSGGTLRLQTRDLAVLETMSFNAAMQFPLLSETKGVSLERINTEKPSNDAENWHSAAQSCGFATPGRVNSQHAPAKEANKQVQLVPECFSPDNDGVDDVGQLLFSLQRTGFLATVSVFDLDGYRVRLLANNVLIASPTDTIIWDATDDYRNLLPNAAYICLVSLIHPDGETFTYKLPWYVARKL